MAELDVEAEAVAHVVKQLGDAQLIAQRIVVCAGAGAVGAHGLQRLLVGVSAVAAVLDADDLHAILHKGLHLVADLLQGAAVGVTVDARSLAHLAAQQVVNGHIRHLALDVPQRFVHAGDGVVEHGAVAPVGADHAHLPDVLDAGDVLAHQQRLHVVGDRVRDRHPALGVGCAADAVQTGLGGHDLDDDQRNAFGCGTDRIDVLNRNSHYKSPP